MALDSNLGRKGRYSSFLFSISPLLLYCFVVSVVCTSSYNSTDMPNQEGSSITYIMGEDKGDQSFYKLAKEYFLLDSIDKTDKVIGHIRSVEELINHLNTSDVKYSRIELVTHGNVWSGLSAKILDGGERSYPKDLLKAKLQEKLPVLRSHLIDSKTIINLWGCGIGRNPIMNIALDKIFTDSEGTRPRVRASADFVVFRKTASRQAPVKLAASYWPYFFKRGYRPSESLIKQKLDKEYPDTEVDWGDAFSREAAENDSASFVNSFHIPVSWTVIFDHKDDRPSVSTEDQKMNWIKSQKGLMKRIKDLEIPIDKYKWTVNKIIHTNEKGEKVPAIKAIGMSTVLCVVKPRVQENRLLASNRN